MNQGKNSAPREAGAFPREATAVPAAGRAGLGDRAPGSGLREHAAPGGGLRDAPTAPRHPGRPRTGGLRQHGQGPGGTWERDKARPAFGSRTPTKDAPHAPAGSLGAPRRFPRSVTGSPRTAASPGSGGGRRRAVPNPASGPAAVLTPQGPGTHAAPPEGLVHRC